MKTFDGYSKEKFSDTSVLLAGGGSKELSNFIGTLNWDSTNRKLQYKKIGDTNWRDLVTFGSNATNSTAYLPLSGGTMTGVITSSFASSSWINGVTNAVIKGTYTSYGAILSMPVKDGRVSLSSYPGDNNNIYFGYATTAQIKAGTNSFNKQMYWDAANNNLHVDEFTGSLVGNASSATKLTSSAGSATLPIYFSDGKPTACTASSLFSNLSNDENNLSITVAGQNRKLTVKYASNASSAEYLNNYYISDPNTQALKDNKVKWFAQINSTTNGNSGYAGNNYGFPVGNNANGILYLGTHHGKYGHQLGFSSNGNIYHRFQNGSDFPQTANGGSWSVLLTSTNYSSILDSHYYTETEANSRFVNVTGDTMTGTLTMSTGAAIRLWDDSATASHRLSLRCASDVGRIYNYTGSAYGTMYVGHDGTNAIVITSGQNVGIGTGSPSYKLDVNGNTRILGNLLVGANASNKYIAFYGATGDAPGKYSPTYIGERLYSSTAETTTPGSNDFSELVLFKGNDTGGTTLTHSGAGSFGPDRIRHIAAAHRFQTYNANTSGTFEAVATSSSLVTKLDIAQALTTSYQTTQVGTSSANANLYVYGNVGIGTSSPSEKLEVSGNIRVINPSSNQVIARFLNYSTAPYGLMIKSSTDGALHLQSQSESNNSEVFPLLLNPNGGNVGIGTTSTSQKLHVSGGIMRITNKGKYVDIGAQNSSWVHFQASQQYYFYNSANNTVFDTHVRPYTSGSKDLGSSSLEWGTGYIRQIYARYLDSSANYTGDHNLFIGYSSTYDTYVYTINPSRQLIATFNSAGITLGNENKQIRRVGKSVMWIDGRDSAIVRQTSPNEYSAVVSSKTASGSWEIGNYTSVGESLYFTYITDSNYSNRNNSITGQVYFNSGGSIYATHFYENSDIRYKKILRNLSINSNTIANLPLFDFEWIENNTIGTGTSAQAVQQILPNLVSGTDKLTLDYGVLGTIAGIIACKELVTQKSELQQLKEKVKQLEDKLRKYENI